MLEDAVGPRDVSGLQLPLLGHVDRDECGAWQVFGADGEPMSEKAQNRIMAVLNLPTQMGTTATKQLVSCCSPGMNDPIMHLMGYTPESPTLEAAFKGKMPKNPERFTVTMDDIVEMFRHINNISTAPGPENAKPVDVIIVGCSHATFEEVGEIARLLKGKKVKDGVMLWVQTDTPSYHMAHQYGDAQIIGGGRWQDLPPNLHDDGPSPAPMTVRHGQLQIREAWRRHGTELDLR